MTDNIQDIDVDSDEFISAPKALRDHVKNLQNANKRLAETNQTLTGQVTASALSGVLAEFKNPERVKRDLLSDKIDPLDSEAVKTWLSANGDDYAKGAASAPSNADPELEQERSAHERINSTELRQPADLSKQEATFQEITPEMNGQDLIKLFRAKGL